MPRGSSTVHRAVAVLLALRDAPAEGLGTSELARRVGANRSTVYRIIDALRPAGLVRSGEGPGTVRLGFGLVELGEAVLGGLDVREVAAPHLRALCDAVAETCHLGMLDDLAVVYVDKAEADHAVSLKSHPGKRQALHTTSLGKSLLAALPAEERDGLLARIDLTGRTSQSITDRDRLLDELRRVRRRGFATDVGENGEGVNCVGAVIRDRSGWPVAAISASAPASRFPRGSLPRHGRVVADVASRISHELGYRASPDGA